MTERPTTQSTANNGGFHRAPRLETLDNLWDPGAPATQSRRQEKLKEEEEQSGDLTDHEVRLKLADMAGQIYLRNWHRSIAMMTPAEATVVAASIIGLATSDQAIRLYDDVLEGNRNTIGQMLQTIEDAATAMKADMEERDRRYQAEEAKAWGADPSPS